MAGTPQLAPLPTIASPTETTPDQTSIPAEISGTEQQPTTPAGSGEIDPPTDEDEMSFVLDAMEQLDAPASDEQDDQQGTQPPAQQTAQPVVPQAPVQPQVPPQAQVPPVAPVAPAAPQAVQPTQPPAQQVAPQDSLRQLATEMERQRENFVQAAAQSYESTFSDDDIAEFQDPEPAKAKKALSKMAARLHADIVQNTFSMMSQHLPVMVQGMIEAQSIQKRAADQFWQQNPDLRAHEAAIAPMAKALRQANPQMDTQTYMAQLAAWARTSLQLTPPVQQQQQPRQQPPRRPSFQPAPAANGRTGAAQQQVADNEWSRVDQIMEADARGVLDTAR